MRRRNAFTLVELLVAMALIIFIMAILSQAFVAATGTFRNLKAAGDMAEKLRATTQLLQRDLSADHFEGKKRLSNPNFWVNGPPQQGYFSILQGSTMVDEGADADGVHSFRSTDHALAFTVKLRGSQQGDFLSASGPLSGVGGFGPPAARYQSGASYNFQWGEVAWWLVPQTDPATGQQDQTVPDPNVAGQPALPLFTLYRRQKLAVPDNTQVPVQPNANITQFLEVSCWPNPNTGNIYFNMPSDLTVPTRRFGGGTGNFTTLATDLGTFSNPGLAGADIQLTDVVSFDVRFLIQGAPIVVDPFMTVWDPSLSGYLNGNPTYSGPLRVFDTWTSVVDQIPGMPQPTDYSQWNVPGPNPPAPPAGATSIPLWGGGMIIQAIQITIRIWDVKTNQTRQVTFVQAT